MVKKWTIAAIAYLLVVMGGYGVYSVVNQPDSPPHPSEEVGH